MSMNRIGYHYLPDTHHYRKSDLNHWLPILKSLNASWLVLEAPHDRAIPEDFIEGLIENQIQPILHFKIAPDHLPTFSDLNLFFSSYYRWGVRYIALFDKPNLRDSWTTTSWTQVDLVERFLDIFLPIAEIAYNAGLTPVFPPLEPGGDYWDTAFLRLALQGIVRRGYASILERMVIGAYADIRDQSLNWGAGGPERWPSAKPYVTPEGTENQIGFRTFDWYQAIAQAVLNKPCPIFLFGIGDSTKVDKTDEQKELAESYLKIARLLTGDKFEDIEAIPEDVIGGAFWLLAAPGDENLRPSAWFQDNGKSLPSVDHMKQWVRENTRILKNAPTFHPVQHYLLLPTYDWGVPDWHMDVIRPFVKKYQPTIGFSIQEAAYAQRVTVVGGHEIFPENHLNELRASGSIVDRIDGDGTEIAAKLARF